jgi:hypothetical protein
MQDRTGDVQKKLKRFLAAPAKYGDPSSGVLGFRRGLHFVRMTRAPVWDAADGTAEAVPFPDVVD